MECPLNTRPVLSHAPWILLLLTAVSCRTATVPHNPGLEPNSEPLGMAQESARTTEGAQSLPLHSISLAVSDTSFQASYRKEAALQEGFWELEYINTEDDNRALNVRLIRGGSVEGTPLWLGVGLGAYSVSYHDSREELFALGLTAAGKYSFDTQPPTLISAEISAAPDATSFKDGESLLDVGLRWEARLGRSATIFIGGRYFAAETGSDDKLTNELQVGLRLGI